MIIIIQCYVVGEGRDIILKINPTVVLLCLIAFVYFENIIDKLAFYR